MDLSFIVQGLTAYAGTLGLSTVRIAVAFLLLPVFSNELVPAMIRSAIFVALAVIVVVLQPPLDLSQFTATVWISVALKEAYLGLSMGIFFGLFLWAFEAAGQVVDTQIGIGMAQVYDPLAGHQTSLIGAFLGRVANYVFVVSGGLTFFVGILFESYVLWPITSLQPQFGSLTFELFQTEFAEFFATLVIIASPILMVLFLVDVCMGLVNREAEQFNVFFLSIPIKILAAIFVLVLSITFLAQLLVQTMLESRELLFGTISRLFI